MSFESIWYCCASAVVAICAVWWTIVSIVKMRAVRAALGRIEQQQGEVLHHAKQAAADSAASTSALSNLLAWHQKRSGEPGNDEVILAIDEARGDMASRITQVEEAHTTAAAIIAQSIAVAMPHLRRFSDWYAEWEARTRRAEAKMQRARAAGYQSKPEPPDPAETPAQPRRAKPKPPG